MTLLNEHQHQVETSQTNVWSPWYSIVLFYDNIEVVVSIIPLDLADSENEELTYMK